MGFGRPIEVRFFYKAPGKKKSCTIVSTIAPPPFQSQRFSLTNVSHVCMSARHKEVDALKPKAKKKHIVLSWVRKG